LFDGGDGRPPSKSKKPEKANNDHASETDDNAPKQFASDHGTAKRAGVGPVAVHRPNPLGTSKFVPRKHEARIKWTFPTMPLPRTILPAIKHAGVVRGRGLKRPIIYNGRCLRALALWEDVDANECEPRYALRINLIELIALPAIMVVAIAPAGGIASGFVQLQLHLTITLRLIPTLTAIIFQILDRR
jgi:hypothetical protein